MQARTEQNRTNQKKNKVTLVAAGDQNPKIFGRGAFLVSCVCIKRGGCGGARSALAHYSTRRYNSR